MITLESQHGRHGDWRALSRAGYIASARRSVNRIDVGCSTNLHCGHQWALTNRRRAREAKTSPLAHRRGFPTSRDSSRDRPPTEVVPVKLVRTDREPYLQEQKRNALNHNAVAPVGKSRTSDPNLAAALAMGMLARSPRRSGAGRHPVDLCWRPPRLASSCRPEPWLIEPGEPMCQSSSGCHSGYVTPVSFSESCHSCVMSTSLRASRGTPANVTPPPAVSESPREP
jgi:hypothetical protein